MQAKLWISDYGFDGALRAFDTSLRKLGLDQVDLYLLHPARQRRAARTAWRRVPADDRSVRCRSGRHSRRSGKRGRRRHRRLVVRRAGTVLSGEARCSDAIWHDDAGGGMPPVGNAAVARALGSALDRMVASWVTVTGDLPRAPHEDFVDPAIYVGEPDHEAWCRWRPLRRPVARSLGELAPDLAPFHPDVEAYFAGWWFLALEGGFGEHVLSLRPVVPGPDPDELLAALRGERDPRFVPIGLDNRSSLRIVCGPDGVVSLEDWERGELDPIAGSLETLLDGLQFG